MHEDMNLPENTPNRETDMGHTQRFFHKVYGGNPNVGWYHGANFKSASHGFNNFHYDQLFYVGIRFILERDEEKRKALWPYLVKGLIAHMGCGRYWSGPNAGAARTEKGNKFVGGTGGPRHAKMFIANVIIGYLLMDQHPFFEAQLRMCMDWWTAQAEMGKDYGSRQSAMNMMDALLLAMAVPDLREDGIEEIIRQMDQMKVHLDRKSWVWLNDGNNGEAHESPWMQTKVVAAIFRCWEHLPETKSHGPSIGDLNNVMKTIFSDYGSEIVGGYRCVFYRYHTKVRRAGSVANTASCLPALRFLAGHGFEWAIDQFKETEELVQLYCDATFTDLRKGVPRPIGSVGYRDGPQSGGWPKTILGMLAAVR
jgi:hypothetical protein